MCYLSSLSFTPLVFNHTYKDDKSTKDFVSDRLSLYFLISNIAVIMPALLFGYLSDRIKVWKMVFGFHLFIFGSLVLFAYYIPNKEGIYTEQNPNPTGMSVGFILLNISSSGIFPLNQALISKCVESCTHSRGVFIGATAFCSSLGVLII